MRVAIVALALCLTGCPGPPPLPGAWYTSSHGVTLYGEHAWSPDEIEAEEDRFLAALDSRFAGADAALAGAQVIMTAPAHLGESDTAAYGWIDCVGQRVSGCAIGPWIVVMRLPLPIQRASYAHELLHWVQWSLLGRVDRWHTDSSWDAVALNPGDR